MNNTTEGIMDYMIKKEKNEEMDTYLYGCVELYHTPGNTSNQRYISECISHQTGVFLELLVNEKDLHGMGNDMTTEALLGLAVHCQSYEERLEEVIDLGLGNLGNVETLSVGFDAKMLSHTIANHSALDKLYFIHISWAKGQEDKAQVKVVPLNEAARDALV